MKKRLIILIALLSGFSMVSCQSTRRVYDDQELRSMAISDYGFQTFSTFKIVDVDTAFEMTGERYQNSGVVIGIRNSQYAMLFVPRSTTEAPMLVLENFNFDLAEIYQLLNILEDDSGNKLFIDPSGDYGGLSLSVQPYQQALSKHEGMQFDVNVFFVITTDTMGFNVAYVNEEIVIFDDEFNILYN